MRVLGPLQVSVVGLGCNNFGRRVDVDGTRAVVDAGLDAGVTFFDTAESYGDGRSEEFLGQALRERRDQVVLATKFGGAPAEGRGSRVEIRRALEGSLQRLQTDYVDLYQHHREDLATPLAETIEALDELVREGKIRAYGTSNYSPAKLEEAAELAREAYVSEQSEYSWLERDAEEELLPTCRRLGLGFIPYFPLASGLLTGKYRRGEPAPQGARHHGREIDDVEHDRSGMSAPHRVQARRAVALTDDLDSHTLQIQRQQFEGRPVVLDDHNQRTSGGCLLGRPCRRL